MSPLKLEGYQINRIRVMRKRVLITQSFKLGCLNCMRLLCELQINTVYIADIRFIKTTLCLLVCLSKLYGKFAIASLVCRRNSFLYVNDAMDLSIQEEGEELGRS